MADGQLLDRERTVSEMVRRYASGREAAAGIGDPHFLFGAFAQVVHCITLSRDGLTATGGQGLGGDTGLGPPGG